MRKRLRSTLAALCLAAPLTAQTLLNLDHACSYDGQEKLTARHTFEPSDEAGRIVAEICNAMSLPQNFTLRSADVANALATSANGQRIILYNTLFLEQFKAASRTRWAAYSVLAHEVGHHLIGHDFKEENPARRKEMELEADRFSGGVLRLLGAPLDDAKSGIEVFAAEAGSGTHPPGSARREAIASGWKRQDERLRDLGVEPTAPESTAKDGDNDDMTRDLAAWRNAKAQNNATAYREYLRQFPQGEFKDAANGALRTFDATAARRRDDTAWEIATEKNTSEGYQKYLSDYPDGLHRGEAEDKLAVSSAPGTYTDPLVGVMVRVEGGTFQMGSNDGRDDEKPVHSVTLDSYYIGQTEVTQAQWRAVMGSDAPDLWFKGCNDCPVERVSWSDVQEFLKKLNTRSVGGYRLPTEAEWEYAARGGKWGGKGSKYAGGNDISTVAWYIDNSDGKTHPVKSKADNELGLYDMAGNVWEWCSDSYGIYENSPSSNPAGAASGSHRVFRGGSYTNEPADCRVAARDYWDQAVVSGSLGFRLARTP